MALKLEVVPEKAIAIRRGQTVVAASWFGPWVQRPYIYPFLGPRGCELTSLGHPSDRVGHSHHRSIWMGHFDVNGVDFWSEGPGTGRILQTGVSEVRAEGAEVSALIECSWQDASGAEVLKERRRLTFIDLGREELAMEIDLVLQPSNAAVTLGKTNFGILGIRVAHTLRVEEKLGGRILNSLEGENEAGCMGQHADWCDFSGPAVVPAAAAGDALKSERADLPAGVVGIACFDHPENSKDGTLWHVRDDGWMGPGVTRQVPREISASEPLRLRYRIESHAGGPGEAAVGERYRLWRRRARGG
jgi:hypothetical protein